MTKFDCFTVPSRQRRKSNDETIWDGAGESLGGLETMRLEEWILKILLNSQSQKLQVAKAKIQIKIKL